jgi:REP element-mobilizing transposase RayT
MMVIVRLTISKDDPCLFITAVANNRLPVFRADALKTITCGAIDEARTSCGFLLFAYVIMPDHIHVLTDSSAKAVSRASIHKRHCQSPGAGVFEGDEI